MILGLRNASPETRESIIKMIESRDLVGLRSTLEKVGGVQEALDHGLQPGF